MKNLPSLKQLEYLIALAEVEHFGKASKICNVTASTLSAGIRDLEEVLGVPIAERTKRHVLMTQLGREISERAMHLLRDAEDIMELVATSKKPLTGDLKLGVIPTIAPFLLPKMLPGLHSHFPDLRLYLREEQTAPLLELLRNGKLDAALIALPYEIDGLASKTLLEDPFQFACPVGHSLTNHELVLHNDLIDQPLLLLEEGHCLRGHALQACDLAENRNNAEFEATSLHTLIQMVAAGLGVTLLPQMAIDAGVLAGTNISIVPLAPGAAMRQIALVWRSSSARTETFELLGEELVLSDR